MTASLVKGSTPQALFDSLAMFNYSAASASAPTAHPGKSGTMSCTHCKMVIPAQNSKLLFRGKQERNQKPASQERQQRPSLRRHVEFKVGR